MAISWRPLYTSRVLWCTFFLAFLMHFLFTHKKYIYIHYTHIDVYVCVRMFTYIYFLLNKQEKKYINEKGYTPRYTNCIQGKTIGKAIKRENTKNCSLSQLDSTQSTKSNKDKVPFSNIHPNPCNNFIINKLFKEWTNCSVFSNSLRFLSFHKVQKIHNRAALQTFLHFLLTKEPRQLNKASLTNKGRNQ